MISLSVPEFSLERTDIQDGQTVIMNGLKVLFFKDKILKKLKFGNVLFYLSFYKFKHIQFVWILVQ
jgi:hypothetical protein